VHAPATATTAAAAIVARCHRMVRSV
jgi:hypothetical protein